MHRIVAKPSRTGLLVLLIAALSLVAAGVFIWIVDNTSKAAGTNATITARTASRPSQDRLATGPRSVASGASSPQSVFAAALPR